MEEQDAPARAGESPEPTTRDEENSMAATPEVPRVAWTHIEECSKHTRGADLIESLVQENRAQSEDDLEKNPARGVVCFSSKTFRKLAIDLLEETDFVLEVGCAHGMCSREIVRRVKSPAHFIGIDTAKLCIRTCMRDLPDHNFRGIDVLTEWWMVADEVKELTAAPDVRRRVVFLDIGGNREFETVVAMVRFLAVKFRFHLIVIKSEQLYEKALETNGFDAARWAQLEAEARTRFADIDGSAAASKSRPTRAPRRQNHLGVEFCAFHNFDAAGCKRRSAEISNSGYVCDRDHDHCHNCGKFGHRALDCEFPNMDPSALDMLMAADPTFQASASPSPPPTAASS
ncbi:Hypothetical Protein FCC1311_086072 [Hondaea fermentalgiana]|uniref:CCHC-type domain-containing protein n=1 Tax=Hondaea fermentalgiana TaxID=2315210 RepID=A0A2R5GN97_9STRA|nr:Hypothetical Protein FCC1311_086072 [Hondaea fermentalgiana]|eukprot:GBG32382.1 Hypothetical Protein FCC1311_086072 [Hondaea fermentalgiana]